MLSSLRQVSRYFPTCSIETYATMTHIYSQVWVFASFNRPAGLIVAHIHGEKKRSVSHFLSETESNSSRCLVVSKQVDKDLLEGRGGDRTENLSRGRRVLLVQSGPGPALVELDKEQRVFEGPPEDNSLHQVDEGHNH